MKKYIYKCDSCSNKWKDYNPAACPKCNKEDFILFSEVTSNKKLLIVFLILAFSAIFSWFFLFKNSVNKDAYFEKGIEYMEQEKYQLAVDNFTRSSELNPNDPEPYFERAKAYSYLENNEEAIADYTKIIELFEIKEHPDLLENVDLSEVYFFRGSFYSVLEKYEEAIADYTKSINIDPDQKNVDRSKKNSYLSRADSYSALEKYEDAIVDYTRVIESEMEGYMFSAYFGRAQGFSYLERYEESFIDFSRALELKPSNTDVIWERGLSYFMKEKYEEALADFENVLRLDSLNGADMDLYGNVYRYRAMAKYNLGIDPCSDYKRACELDPEDERKKSCKWFKDECSSQKEISEKERREQRKKDQKAILERFLNTTTAQFSYWGGDKYKSGKDWVYGKNHNGKSRYKIFGLSKYNLSTKKGDVLHLKYIKRLYIRTSTYERIKNRNPNTLRSL